MQKKRRERVYVPISEFKFNFNEQKILIVWNGVFLWNGKKNQTKKQEKNLSQ